jgi:hypothetical protein
MITAATPIQAWHAPAGLRPGSARCGWPRQGTGDQQRPGCNAPAPAQGPAGHGPVRRGPAGCGPARPGRAGRGLAWQGFNGVDNEASGARPGRARQGLVWRGEACLCTARQGPGRLAVTEVRDLDAHARLGQAGLAMARPGAVRRGDVWLGKVPCGQKVWTRASVARLGMPWRCQAGRGMVRHGETRQGRDRIGWAGTSSSVSGATPERPTQHLWAGQGIGSCWVRHGSVGRGSTWQGRARTLRCGQTFMAGHGTAVAGTRRPRLGAVRRGKGFRAASRHPGASPGRPLDAAWRGQERHGAAGPGAARTGKAWAMRGGVGRGQAVPGTAWLGAEPSTKDGLDDGLLPAQG